MKQDKQGQLAKTERFIGLGESVFLQLQEVLNGEEFDDRIDLEDDVSDEIKKKRARIKKIDDDKEELILKIIGQLYNGALIPQKLSFRKGKVFEFRRQSPSGINRIKEIIMANLHEVVEKMTKSSLDILEFVLKKAYSNPTSHISENFRNNDTARQKIIRFPELRIIEKDGDEVAEKHFDIIFLNGVVISDEGSVDFFYEHKDEKGDLKTEFPRLESETFAGLYIKFENQIKENADVFIKELNTEIINAEKEIVEITDKGQNQLALCELISTGDEKDNKKEVLWEYNYLK